MASKWMKVPFDQTIGAVIDDPETRARNRFAAKYMWWPFVTSLKADAWDKPEDMRIDNCIKLDSTENVLDGQNRCMAIIHTGISAYCWVAFNQPRSHVSRYDAQNRRKVSENVFIEFGIEDSKKKHELIRAARNIIGIEPGSEKTLSTNLIKQWVDDHEDGMGFALSIWKRKKHQTEQNGLRGAGILAAAMLAYPMADERTILFMDRFLSGTGLQEGDPELALRGQILNNIGRSAAGWAPQRLTGRLTLRAMIGASRGLRFVVMREHAQTITDVCAWHEKRLGHSLIVRANETPISTPSDQPGPVADATSDDPTVQQPAPPSVPQPVGTGIESSDLEPITAVTGTINNKKRVHRRKAAKPNGS